MRDPTHGSPANVSTGVQADPRQTPATPRTLERSARTRTGGVRWGEAEQRVCVSIRLKESCRRDTSGHDPGGKPARSHPRAVTCPWRAKVLWGRCVSQQFWGPMWVSQLPAWTEHVDPQSSAACQCDAECISSTCTCNWAMASGDAKSQNPNLLIKARILLNRLFYKQKRNT